MQYDDIIIGAGVSGMTTAILLAQSSRKVAVFEQSSTIAPTIRGFERKGVYFDTGFHYAAMLGKGEFLHTLCDRLGILPQIEVKASNNNSGDIFYHIPSGFKIEFSNSLEYLEEKLKCIFPDESAGIEEYLRIISNYVTRINRDLFSSVLSPESLFANGDVSLQDYLNSRFTSPQLKTIFSLHAVLYGSLPGETSMRYHSMIAGGYYDKIQQIYNGGYALSDAFKKQMKKYGVDIHTSASVSSIIVDDRLKVKGVTVQDGSSYQAENCIYTGHPRFLLDLLPESAFRPVFRSRIARMEDTVSAMVVYCKDNATENLSSSHRNIFLYSSLFPDIFGDGTESGQGPIFISRSISRDKQGGVSLLYPCDFNQLKKWEDSFIRKRPAEYYQWKKETAESLLQKVQASCPLISKHLEIIDIASPLTFRDYMKSPCGSLYGIKHLVDNMPLMARTKVSGLLLAGQATLAAGLAGAMVSGFLAAGHITGEDFRKTMS
ncbi:MAG: NAD(P)/FAD-dependent oxidoreductase [Sedimentisphaerales bacterium]|nr:NAD(P)/FAD-dependent oxidoreductase [Sedimentisphaerales bacterium]